MRAFRRWLLVVLALCAGWFAYSAAAQPDSPASPRQQHVWAVDARRGVVELLGTHDGSRAGWNRHIAEWGGLNGPHWWQSALAVLTMIHYAEQTHGRSPLLQHVLDVTYTRNVYK